MHVWGLKVGVSITFSRKGVVKGTIFAGLVTRTGVVTPVEAVTPARLVNRARLIPRMGLVTPV